MTSSLYFFENINNVHMYLLPKHGENEKENCILT